jgi:protein phosphatase
MAVETIRSAYFAHPSRDPREALEDAFQQAQAAILASAANNADLDGMGTTCTCAIVRGSELFYGHVGDSRLYLIRDASIQRVTDDHSYVSHLVREGRITSEEADSHPERNILMAALGMKAPVPADFSEQPLSLASNDILLLCTDGLHGLVRDPELLEMAQNRAPGDACRDLVELAKQRGGFDNITVQILRIS